MLSVKTAEKIDYRDNFIDICTIYLNLLGKIVTLRSKRSKVWTLHRFILLKQNDPHPKTIGARSFVR